MLARQPDAAARQSIPHDLNVFVALLEADLKAAVAPVAGEVIGDPVGGVDRDRRTVRRCRVVTGEKGEVGAEEFDKMGVTLGRLVGGDQLRDVLRLLAEDVEEQCGMAEAVWESRAFDGFLIPVFGVERRVLG